jgi:hypothetical protein
MQKNRKIRKIEEVSSIKKSLITKINKKTGSPKINKKTGSPKIDKKRKQKMIKILHIVIGASKQKDRFIRNFITYKDTDEITNYFIVPDTEKEKNFIKSNNKIFISEFNYRDIILSVKEIKPDAIISSNTLDKKLFIELKKICNNINYVHHGLVSKHLWEVKPKHEKNWKLRWEGFNNYFGFGINFKRFIKELLNTNNVYAYGIPQIDYMLSLNDETYLKFKESFSKKYNFEINQKVILLVAGGTGITINDYLDYIDHISILSKIAKNNGCKLLVKTKDNIKWYTLPSHESIEKIDNFFNESYISLIEDNDPIYHYFFSDVIVVQETGSVVIEGILANKNVIESHINIKNDYWDLSKYKKMPYSTNKAELENIVEKMLNSTYDYNEEFFSEKNSLIKELINYHLYQNNACERILNEIVKNIKK